MALKIIGRREDDNGANTHYKFNDSSIGDNGVVTRAEAVQMAKDEKLPNYNIYPINGVEYLRDNPDTSEADNIDSQPLI